MRALSPTDELFLLIERHRQPMHVAGLLVLEPRHQDDALAQTLYAHFSRFEQAVSPFDERLVLTPLGYCWVKDAHFDLANHLRRAALPSPGGQAELDAWVSAHQEVPLHRERPLWEVHIIEGLQGGRVAIYCKVHHALLDGVSALRAGLIIFSADRDQPMAAPFWSYVAPARTSPVRARSAFAQVLRELALDTRDELRALPTLAREAKRVLSETGKHLLRSLRGHDTQNPFAGRITGARRFGSLSLSLARVEHVSRQLGGTVNDLALAMCSTALRSYLEERGLRPTRPLCAMVPVSLRHGAAGRGNRLATLITDLAIEEADLAQRVARVWGSVREGKARFAKLSDDETVGVTAMTLAPTFLSVSLHARRDISQFNVVISNVPGPRQDLFLGGARLRCVYPVSIVVDHVALNISFTSHAGALDFGIVACRHAVPDMAQLVRHLEAALSSLEALAKERSAGALVGSNQHDPQPA